MEIIDVHAHCLPAELKRFLGRRNVRPSPLTCVADSAEDMAHRLALMDQAGVAMQVLSPLPWPDLGDIDAQVEMARISNDGLAAVVRAHPGRFSTFVCLPLPHVEAALAELDRSLRAPGVVGVNLLTAVGCVSAVEPQFDPLWAELDRRKAVVFFHPQVNGLCSPLIVDHNLGPYVGPLIEDSVLVTHLIVRRIPQRFPNVRIIVPHLGGMTPMFLDRFDNQLPVAFPEIVERPSATARGLWYDTASHSSTLGLKCACEAFGASRILSGSDFPVPVSFGGYADSMRYPERSGLTAAEVRAIAYENAATLLGLELGSIGP